MMPRMTTYCFDFLQVNREMHMVTYLNQKAGKKPVSEKEIFL